MEPRLCDSARSANARRYPYSDRYSNAGTDADADPNLYAGSYRGA